MEPTVRGAGDEEPAGLRVVVATRAPGPLEDITRRRPRLEVEAFPVGRLLLLRCKGDSRGLDEPNVWGALPDRHFLHAHVDRSGIATVLLEGSGDEAPVAALLAEGAHLVPPIVWRRGEARVTLLVPPEADLGRIRALFPDGRVVAKRAVDAPRARALFASPLLLPDLTRKQASAILAAHEAGYYDFPRRVTTGDVAAKLGVARSTFEQHLNRAESQVIGALLPVVRLRARDPEAPPGAAAGRADADAVEVFSRFSRELGLFVVMELAAGRVRSVRLARAPPDRATRKDHPYLRRVLEHARTGREDLTDVPVDLGVGAFEREVLELLRSVPAGETVTYGELARRLGRPGAARAVGNACAKNPALVVIPCHRVVPASGALGRYAGEGGADTKRKLIDRERRGRGDGA